MADADPVLAIASGTGADAPGDGRRCEYCHCKLTAKGEVLEMSQRARELRTLEDRLAREQADHATTRADLTASTQRIGELTQQIATLETTPAPRPAPWGLG